MDYIELSVPVAGPMQAEIAAAMLSDLPFEAFEECGGCLKAYIPEGLYDTACRAAAAAALGSVGITGAESRRIARSNWNAEWESDFAPVDIDEWACGSCRESAELNGVGESIETLCGSVESVVGRRFDFILANIGRNAVVEMMPAFADMLGMGGRCVVSGFLALDTAAVEAAAAGAGLEREMEEECDGWAVVACRRARGERRR